MTDSTKETKVVKHKEGKKKVRDNDFSWRQVTQYNNRAHQAVITQAFESEAGKLQQARVNRKRQLHSQIQQLEEELERTKWNKNVSFTAWNMQNNKRIKLLEEEKRLDKDEAHWKEQVSILKCGKLSSLCQANRLLRRAPELFTYDNDRCTHCHSILMFKPQTYMCTCPGPGCKRMQKGEFIQEDASMDVLIRRTTTSGVEEPSTNAKVPRVVTAFAQEKRREQLCVKRKDEFRQFLQQYEENVPPIPNACIDFVYQNTTMVRLSGSVQIRPTFVQAILEKDATFCKFVPQAGRIARMFNGQKIPRLKQSTIDQMVEQFDSLRRCCNKKDDNKVLTCDVVAALLLRMHQDDVEACKFFLHKQEEVLKKANSRLIELTAETRLKEPNLWNSTVASALF